MKNQQQQQARDMFIQDGLTKTEIADKLGVSRRSVYQWCIDGNWEQLRASARNMPAILAEKCYYIIGHFTEQLLQKDREQQPLIKAEVDMLHKLVNTAGKLKKGSTVSENMETFTYFLERVQKHDPDLAARVAPHVSEYIEDRRGVDEWSFLLQGFDAGGYLPATANEPGEKPNNETIAGNDEELQKLNEQAILDEIYQTKQKTYKDQTGEDGAKPPLYGYVEEAAFPYVTAAALASQDSYQRQVSAPQHEPARYAKPVIPVTTAPAINAKKLFRNSGSLKRSQQSQVRAAA
ncbi:MAG: helix-turn-helix domain-containing protein [Bacteroidota bacterium]